MWEKQTSRISTRVLKLPPWQGPAAGDLTGGVARRLAAELADFPAGRGFLPSLVLSAFRTTVLDRFCNLPPPVVFARVWSAGSSGPQHAHRTLAFGAHSASRWNF